MDATHRVQSGWRNWNRASGVLFDRRMNGEGVQDSRKTNRDRGSEEGTL